MTVVIKKRMNIADIQKLMDTLPSGKLFNAAKHCGVLRLSENPLEFQKRIRSEWD